MSPPHADKTNMASMYQIDNFRKQSFISGIFRSGGDKRAGGVETFVTVTLFEVDAYVRSRNYFTVRPNGVT